MLKQVVTALKMMPLQEGLNIPFFTKYINEDEKFVSDETLERSAHTMIRELIRWSDAMKELRK